MQYLDIVKLSTREEVTKLRLKKSSISPRLLSFAQISPLLWSFSPFWLSFIGIEVLNEEEYSILRILYCYNLQQQIFLAFHNNFDMHRRMFIYM